MSEEPEEKYTPDIFDLAGAILVISAAWYFDFAGYVSFAVDWLLAQLGLVQ